MTKHFTRHSRPVTTELPPRLASEQESQHLVNLLKKIKKKQQKLEDRARNYILQTYTQNAAISWFLIGRSNEQGAVSFTMVSPS